MKRRQFFGVSAAAAVAISSPRLLALDPNNRYRKQIGIQLYTLRGEFRRPLRSTICNECAQAAQSIAEQG